MSRSPLAYPLVRNADGEIGGAADLQTDVMRFMAILALCLVAIFALVQAIPMAPAPEPVETVAEPQAAVPVQAKPVVATAEPAPAPPPEPVTTAPAPAVENVALTRPKWVPKYTPQERTAVPAEPVVSHVSTPQTINDPPPPVKPGFTLRFASDSALMQAVAAHDVGVYAIEPGRALRMTVSDSRISFWDASIPNTFHEMETSTVPAAVVAALSRTGTSAEAIAWGVTLPGRLRGELDALMQEHDGGLLVIGGSGAVHWEAPQ